MNKRFFLAVILLSLGVFILTYTSLPLFMWYAFYLPKIESSDIISPIAQMPQSLWQDKEEQVTKRETSSFTNQNQDQLFYLSIPKLNIKDAQVKVGSRDFFTNLAQYPGSALPGEQGNVFIVGHSVLPQFYNPKNYLTIFSTLYELEKGDKVFLFYAGREYLYQIETLKVVDPNDVWVLAPPDRFGRWLTLFTCTPPGLKSQRLVVQARIIDGEEIS